MFDGRWASHAQEGASFAALAVASFGAVAPIALALSALVGVASWLLHPYHEPTVGGFVHALRQASSGRPADVAAFAPLAALGVFTWATATGQLARLLRGATAASKTVGAALALGALAILVVLGLAVFALTPPVRRGLALGSSRWPSLVDPSTTLALGLGVVAALVAFGTFRGTVSGEGGFLGIYGIFKRPELDLRMPAAWLGFATAVYLAPGFAGELPALTKAAALVLPLILTGHQARALERHLEVARALERGAPVARIPLSLLRRFGDRDRDGASAWFGGGDCDDRDPGVGPSADDIPDNGRDEDCSGSDLSLADAGASPPATAAPAPSGLDRLPKHANLVLVTVDTLRADLGFAGYSRPVSPNLDVLARRSTVFERAYSLASYTGKSVGPTLIGKYGSETHRNWGHFNQFSAEDTFVAERIHRAGLRTFAVHAHRYFGRFGGLDRGFDEVDLSAAPPEGASWATDQTATSARLTDAALERLRKVGRDERFFLWVHYIDPHADYLTHDDVPKFGGSARELYDHEVAHTDRHIGRLVDFVSSQPWADRTSIVVTSDHGEAFGEHGMQRHGLELWEPLVRVPLVVHVPGLPPSRVSERRSLVDLVPTMLEILGLPVPPHRDVAPPTSSDFVSGVSLVSDLLREPGAPAAARDVLIDMPAGPYNEARRALIRGELKLIVSNNASKEVYDLAKDPREAVDVWGDERKAMEAAYALTKGRLRTIDVRPP